MINATCLKCSKQHNEANSLPIAWVDGVAITTE